MTDPLPPHIWFLVWRGRFWAIRRQGDIMIVKLLLSTMAVAIVGFLLAGFVHWVVGVAFGTVGIGVTQWRFNSVRKQHTDHTMTLEEWKRRRAAD
jgi:hypothetical protein